MGEANFYYFTRLKEQLDFAYLLLLIKNIKTVNHPPKRLQSQNVWTRRRQKEAVEGGEESRQGYGRRRHRLEEEATRRAEEAQGGRGRGQGGQTHRRGRHQKVGQEITNTLSNSAFKKWGENLIG